MENIDMRYQYSQFFYCMLTECDGENFVLLDEVGFQVTMRRSRGRSEQKSKANAIIPQIRSRNISCCAIMKKMVFMVIGSKKEHIMAKLFFHFYNNYLFISNMMVLRIK
ncbi:hypothetical protein M153_2950001057 [Pseudoloma neurophilia]|uniref:Uncharacterized protein n=1 Tax=Pseudoloma neurophilia TaxID=146866 RepID=A0A0R0LYB5_9MICR|nr:hypothetical protein M153_2950001057 [Pseudoloma neurophilia]